MKVKDPKIADVQNTLMDIHDELFPETKHISPSDAAFLRACNKKPKFYAGIGSRSTPQLEMNKLTLFAEIAENDGFVLRSGGAEGADKAFEAGVKNPENKRILRPKHATKEAEEIASKIHPAWHMCNEYARALHARNVQIILGKNLDEPAEFVVAWTLNPTMGGTSLGIRLALSRKIPYFNLADASHQVPFMAFFKGGYKI